MELSLELQLPFRLPIEDGKQIISIYEEEKFITVFDTQNSPVIVSHVKQPPFEKAVTVLKLKYLPNPQFAENLDHDELLNYTIYSTIDYINSIIDAIRFSFELSYLYNITIFNFPLTVSIDIDKIPYLYVTQPQELLNTDYNLNDKQFNEFLSTMATHDRYPEIYLVEKFYSSAKSHLYREEFIDAIVDLQTSFEIYIRNTHRLILLYEGKEKDVSKISFRNIIEHHLSKYLKVDLNFETEGIINEWYKYLYSVRNEIVHNGKITIDGDSAYKAYDVYVHVRKYISDKLYEHGYLDEDRNVDLTLFRKNNEDFIDSKEVIKELQKKGHIDENIVIENS